MVVDHSPSWRFESLLLNGGLDVLAVDLLGLIVGGPGGFFFGGADVAGLLRPALLDGTETPLGALFGEDWFFVEVDPDWVGVGGGEDSYGYPGAAVYRGLELDVVELAVGGDVFCRYRFAVDDQLYRDFVCIADAGTFDCPVGLLVVGKFLQSCIGDFVEECCGFEGDVDLRFLIELDVAGLVVDLEIHEVGATVGEVAAAFFKPVDPFAVSEWGVEFDVGAALADAVVGDAGEVGFSGDSGAIAEVEGVIPNAEFPDVGGVAAGDVVDGVGLGDVDDEFVGADAIEARDLEAWDGSVRDLEAPAGMRVAGDGTLLFGPLEDGYVPGGPVFETLGAGVVLIA